MDAESVAAQQGDIIGLAGMHLGVELGGVAEGRREPGDVRRGGRVEDLGVVLVLLDDHEDMVVARDALQAGAASARERRPQSHRGDSDFDASRRRIGDPLELTA